MGCLRSRLSGLFLLTLIGCGGVSDTGVDTAVIEDQVCDELDKTQVAIITEMWFARVNEGVTNSVNLDGDEPGCGQEDYVSPNGDAGVDNSFGSLIPILELTEGAEFDSWLTIGKTEGDDAGDLSSVGIDWASSGSCLDLALGWWGRW